jgi:hypothetical protein
MKSIGEWLSREQNDEESASWRNEVDPSTMLRTALKLATKFPQNLFNPPKSWFRRVTYS